MASDNRGFASMVPRLCIVSLLIALFAAAFAAIVSKPRHVSDAAQSTPCVLKDGQGCGPS
ncbi:MAG: hypothetical protein EPN45_02620 [Rhizobiaceae bacterium]|nr:MAG: hypothetical protein EPN45_02620 [Rhizobiaceae bacterium]